MLYAKFTTIITMPECCSECPFENGRGYCPWIDAETIEFRGIAKHINCPLEPYEL